MVGMEVNAGAPFDCGGKTVTQLITWLQSQDQNSRVEPDGGGTLRFRKLRAHAGGHIQVEVERPKRRRSKPKDDTDDPQADKDELSFHEETKRNQDKQVEEHKDTVKGKNEGRDQGGVVPGTTKTPSDKPVDSSGKTTK